MQTLPPTQTGGRPHFSSSAAPPPRIRDSCGRKEGKGENRGASWTGNNPRRASLEGPSKLEVRGGGPADGPCDLTIQ